MNCVSLLEIYFRPQAHIYTSRIEKTRANEQCCGTARMSAGLSCCNGNGYNPLTQVCSDVSDQLSGRYHSCTSMIQNIEMYKLAHKCIMDCVVHLRMWKRCCVSSESGLHGFL